MLEPKELKVIITSIIAVVSIIVTITISYTKTVSEVKNIILLVDSKFETMMEKIEKKDALMRLHISEELREFQKEIKKDSVVYRQ